MLYKNIELNILPQLKLADANKLIEQALQFSVSHNMSDLSDLPHKARDLMAEQIATARLDAHHQTMIDFFKPIQSIDIFCEHVFLYMNVVEFKI